jgi:two-component system chemotaxis response regulator CheB
MAERQWLKRVLVRQFEFLEWTGDNHLRHSKFTGLREDKRQERLAGTRRERLGAAGVARKHTMSTIIEPSETVPSAAGMWFIGIAASAGGLTALTELLAGLPDDLSAAVAIVQHRVPAKDTHLQSLLSRRTLLPLAAACDRLLIQSGTVYVASSENHLTVTDDGRFSHEDGLRVHGLHSAANPLFQSASRVFRERAIAVVLTGNGSDGSEGVLAVSRMGGIVIAQDPATAEYIGMPQSAIDTGVVDYVIPLPSIAATLVEIVRGVAPAHERYA